MSEANSTPVQEKPKKKKRHLWWLNLLLTLIVFAGGVVLGLKLNTMPEPYALLQRYFPQLVAQTETVKEAPAVTVAPTPTEAPVATLAPTPAPTEAPKPEETPAPEEPEEPAEAEEQKPAAEPETAPAPAAETVAEVGGVDGPTSVTAESTDAEAAEPETEAAGVVGPEAALGTALKHAKADEDEAEVYGVYKSLDVDTVVYTVEFSVGGAEYRYMINAATGAVEGWQKLRTSQSTDGDEPSVPQLYDAGSDAVSPEAGTAGTKGPGVKGAGGKK